MGEAVYTRLTALDLAIGTVDMDLLTGSSGEPTPPFWPRSGFPESDIRTLERMASLNVV